MMYVELCDKVEAALAGRASYSVSLIANGTRNVESRNGTYQRKRKWVVSTGPYWHSVESSTPEGAYAAFLAALLPLVEPVPTDAGADVGV